MAFPSPCYDIKGFQWVSLLFLGVLLVFHIGIQNLSVLPSSPKEVHNDFTQFSRWPWVTDPDLGSWRICQMVLGVIRKRPHSKIPLLGTGNAYNVRELRGIFNGVFCILLPRPLDKFDMTLGQGQWPRVIGRTGWNHCALLLEKKVVHHMIVPAWWWMAYCHCIFWAHLCLWMVGSYVLPCLSVPPSICQGQISYGLSLKVMILAGGLTSLSSCFIYIISCGVCKGTTINHLGGVVQNEKKISSKGRPKKTKQRQNTFFCSEGCQKKKNFVRENLHHAPPPRWLVADP